MTATSSTPIAIVPNQCLLRALLLFPQVISPGFKFINIELVPDWMDFQRRQYSNSSNERDREYLAELEKLVKIHPNGHPNALINGAHVRSLANVYVKQGQSIVYLFDDKLPNLLDTGPQLGYRAALHGLDVVDESKLTMEQVEEFRRDINAVEKYRALRLWLHHGLKAESLDQANDIVAKKLSDYNWAIKKHGLITMTGAIESVLDSKHMASIAGGAGITALFAGPIWASIAGGLLVGAGVATWMAKQAISLEDIKRGPHSEVAIIYEAQKKFGRNSDG